jgi:hypothetical protein
MGYFNDRTPIGPIGRLEIHVYYRHFIRHWTAEGFSGSYGISTSFEEALQIACDAARSINAHPRIFVHRDKTNTSRVHFIITKVKHGKASSQFFQEEAT